MFSFHHVALSVTDLERSITFYGCLGFAVVHEWRAEDGTLAIAHMKLGGALLELFCYADAAGEVAGTLEQDLRRVGVKHFALQVADIHESAQRLSREGLVDEVVISTGRTGVDYFFITDPDGLFVEIVQDDRELGRSST